MTCGRKRNQISFYGSFDLVVITLALGSCDFIALNAAKLAVPPPISRYGTLLGISFEVGGTFTEFGKFQNEYRRKSFVDRNYTHR